MSGPNGPKDHLGKEVPKRIQTVGMERENVLKDPSNPALSQYYWRRLKTRWLWLLFFVMIGFIGGGAAIYVFPPTYAATAILSPTSEGDQSILRSVSGSLGGLASFAGIDLPQNSASQKTIAIAIIKSRNFLVSFAESRHLVSALIADEGWGFTNNQIVLPEEGGELQKLSPPPSDGRKDLIGPSPWKIYEAMSERLLLYENSDSGLITLGFSLTSPSEAKRWTELLVKDINEHLRRRTLDDVDKRLAFLRAELDTTSSAPIRSSLYQIIELQLRKKMIAQTKPEYAFEVIDPPVIPESPVFPRPIVLMTLSVVSSLLLGVVAILFPWGLFANLDRLS